MIRPTGVNKILTSGALYGIMEVDRKRRFQNGLVYYK